MKITSNKPEPVEETIQLELQECKDYMEFWDVEDLFVGEDNILKINFNQTQAEALYDALGKQLGKSEDSQSNWEKILKDMERLNPRNEKTYEYDPHKRPWTTPFNPPDFQKWGDPIVTYLTKGCDKTTTDLIKTVSNLFEDLATTRNNKTTQNNTKTQ